MIYQPLPPCNPLNHLVPHCIKLYNAVPSCTTLYQAVPSCTNGTVYYALPTCTPLYHHVPPCTTLYHPVLPSTQGLISMHCTLQYCCSGTSILYYTIGQKMYNTMLLCRCRQCTLQYWCAHTGNVHNNVYVQVQAHLLLYSEDRTQAVREAHTVHTL